MSNAAVERCACRHSIDDHDLRGNSECSHCLCGHEIDAGIEREALFQAMVEGNLSAQPFFRRVGRLARLTGTPVATIVTDLRAELGGVG